MTFCISMVTWECQGFHIRDWWIFHQHCCRITKNVSNLGVTSMEIQKWRAMQNPQQLQVSIIILLCSLPSVLPTCMYLHLMFQYLPFVASEIDFSLANLKYVHNHIMTSVFCLLVVMMVSGKQIGFCWCILRHFMIHGYMYVHIILKMDKRDTWNRVT